MKNFVLILQGDQASIVGGAIEFVKELEHHLQCLEAQKFTLLQQDTTTTATTAAATNKFLPPPPTNTTTPFAQFFTYPQYTCSSSSTANCSQIPNNHKYTSKSKAAIADIEVTLIETHANVRILSRRRFRQISKLVTGFQTLYLTILHLNVTTLDPLVLYSISAKVRNQKKKKKTLFIFIYFCCSFIEFMISYKYRHILTEND